MPATKKKSKKTAALSKVASQIKNKQAIGVPLQTKVIDAFVVRLPNGTHGVYDKRYWGWRFVSSGSIEVFKK